MRNLIGLMQAYKNSCVSLASDSRMTEMTKWVPYLAMCTELLQNHYLLTTARGE